MSKKLSRIERLKKQKQTLQKKFEVSENFRIMLDAKLETKNKQVKILTAKYETTREILSENMQLLKGINVDVNFSSEDLP